MYVYVCMYVCMNVCIVCMYVCVMYIYIYIHFQLPLSLPAESRAERSHWDRAEPEQTREEPERPAEHRAHIAILGFPSLHLKLFGGGQR